MLKLPENLAKYAYEQPKVSEESVPGDYFTKQVLDMPPPENYEALISYYLQLENLAKLDEKDITQVLVYVMDYLVIYGGSIDRGAINYFFSAHFFSHPDQFVKFTDNASYVFCQGIYAMSCGADLDGIKFYFARAAMLGCYRAVKYLSYIDGEKPHRLPMFKASAKQGLYSKGLFDFYDLYFGVGKDNQKEELNSTNFANYIKQGNITIAHLEKWTSQKFIHPHLASFFKLCHSIFVNRRPVRDEDTDLEKLKKNGVRVPSGMEDEIPFLLDSVAADNITENMLNRLNLLPLYKQGLSYYHGFCGKTKDPFKALNSFKDAAKSGHLPSLYMLGICRLNDFGVVNQKEQGITDLIQAAGKFFVPSIEKLLDLVMPSDSQLSDQHCQLIFPALVACLDQIDKIPCSDDFYLKLIKALQGLVDSGQKDLAPYLRMVIEKLNPSFSSTLLHQVAAQFSENEQYEHAADIYYAIFQKSSDEKEAIDGALNRLVEKKSIRASRYLGMILIKDKQYLKAETNFKQAAENNDAVSYYQLGIIYKNGYLGKPDYHRAYEHYKCTIQHAGSEQLNNQSVAALAIEDLLELVLIGLEEAENYILDAFNSAPEKNVWYEALTKIANKHQEEGKWADAIKFYRALSEANHLPAKLKLIECCQKDGRGEIEFATLWLDAIRNNIDGSVDQFLTWLVKVDYSKELYDYILQNYPKDLDITLTRHFIEFDRLYQQHNHSSSWKEIIAAKIRGLYLAAIQSYSPNRLHSLHNENMANLASYVDAGFDAAADCVFAVYYAVNAWCDEATYRFLRPLYSKKIVDICYKHDQIILQRFNKLPAESWYNRSTRQKELAEISTMLKHPVELGDVRAMLLLAALETTTKEEAIELYLNAGKRYANHGTQEPSFLRRAALCYYLVLENDERHQEAHQQLLQWANNETSAQHYLARLLASLQSSAIKNIAYALEDIEGKDLLVQLVVEIANEIGIKKEKRMALVVAAKKQMPEKSELDTLLITLQNTPAAISKTSKGKEASSSSSASSSAPNPSAPPDNSTEVDIKITHFLCTNNLVFITNAAEIDPDYLANSILDMYAKGNLTDRHFSKISSILLAANKLTPMYRESLLKLAPLLQSDLKGVTGSTSTSQSNEDRYADLCEEASNMLEKFSSLKDVLESEALLMFTLKEIEVVTSDDYFSQESLIDPVNLSIMEDPVALSSGQSIDRQSFQKILVAATANKQNPLCPVTKQILNLSERNDENIATNAYIKDDITKKLNYLAKLIVRANRLIELTAKRPVIKRRHSMSVAFFPADTAQALVRRNSLPGNFDPQAMQAAALIVSCTQS